MGTLADTLRKLLDDRLVRWLLAAWSAAAAALVGLVVLVPKEWLDAIGTARLAQAVVGLVLVVLLLVAWVVVLHYRQAAKPKRTFLPELGVMQDPATGHYHCTRCGTPLQTQDYGWFCLKCPYPYYTKEHLKKVAARKAEEDARVRAFNQGGGWMNWRR